MFMCENANYLQAELQNINNFLLFRECPKEIQDYLVQVSFEICRVYYQQPAILQLALTILLEVVSKQFDNLL